MTQPSNHESWPPAMIEALAKHRKNGLSCSNMASAIAQEFRQWPKPINRNVIVGKINRLRVKFPEDSTWAAKMRTPRSKDISPKIKHARLTPLNRARGASPSQTIGKGSGVKFSAVTGIPLAAEEKVEPQYFTNSFEPFEGCEPKTLFDLKLGQCKWPVDVKGSTLQMFCGQSSPGAIYCIEHGGVTGGRRK